jgi:hypothetical protein
MGRRNMYLTYKIEIVCAYTRNDTPISTKLRMLIPWNQKTFCKGQNSESVLSSSPGECGFCSLETKHHRRTAPRPKLFVSTRKIQDEGHNPDTCIGIESN